MQGPQRRRELMRLGLAAAAVALLAGLTTACAHDDGSTGTPQKAAATPSGYAEMQQKVSAAESALARADKDAAQDH
ncbi:hypothetical protein [Streptomyces griseorubiginosus]|uniref:hypothetical protein n=1 Tax=Streptomyces griseorubiginosus TaxID=67304 RepID=UPI001AD71C3A|nr:hypothetical protein [Streptomyces griseorubiginosus]MBO4253411.1 hypothetical protein [Streptomyces griseorubiginosus]